MPDGVLAWVVACAVAYLLGSYAIGGPLALVRALVVLASRRRARYRGHADETLATSRFTIPVSVLLPVTDGHDVTAAVEQLLALTYPELEVIVIGATPGGAAPPLRERFDLKACEIFFRRSLPAPPVRTLYRSGADARLLVVESDARSRGDALNCGVNLARYRYVCCADARARYDPGSLLASMQPAVEDPGKVVAVTTSLTATCSGEPADDLAEGAEAILQRLSGIRELLGRGGRRRLRLSPEGLPGFTLWRRDVVLEVEGFARDLTDEHADLTLRAHRHFLRAPQPYRIVHITEPLGRAADAPALAALLVEQFQRRDALVGAILRSRGMLLNPTYGRVGLIDMPQLLLTVAVVPWFELLCMAALPFAPLVGILSVGQLAGVLAAIAIGNGLLINTALLQSPPDTDERRAFYLVLLGPAEVFLSRPARLWSRVRGLLRRLTDAPEAPQPAA